VGPGPIDAVADLLEHLVCQEASLSALVVATVRPGGDLRAGPLELVTFHDLRERFDELGVDIVDWFLVAGKRASSMAELTDSQARWRHDRGR
jgi:hypothetical protein